MPGKEGFGASQAWPLNPHLPLPVCPWASHSTSLGLLVIVKTRTFYLFLAHVFCG